MLRLKDIAQMAGVSAMTVSKALRDSPDISSVTRARIRAIAQKVGYVPHSVARGLRTRRSCLIGLLVPAATNPVYARVILAVEEKAAEAGYEVVLGHSLNRSDREELLIRRFIARRIDGLLVAPVYTGALTSPAYSELQRCGVPTVVLGPTAPFCSLFPCVEADDFLGGELATRHLLELGHRRIAFLSGPAQCPWASARFAGYRRALRAANLEVNDRHVFSSGNTIDEGRKAARQLLEESPDATAVFAATDLVAVGAGVELLDAGRRIPQDIALVGFGNFLISEHFRVPLTTVRQPKHEMGAVGTELLFRLLAGERPASRRLPVNLVVRASTAPPRAGA